MNKKTIFPYLLLISANICFGMENPIPMLKTICFKALSSRQLLMGNNASSKTPKLRGFIKALKFIQSTKKMSQELSVELAKKMYKDSSTIQRFMRRVRSIPLRIKSYENEDNMPVLIRFSPNSKKLLAASNVYCYGGSYHHFLYLWDINNRSVPLCMKGHHKEISSISFSPNNKQIASGSLDKTVRLWDAKTGKHVHTFKQIGSPVFSVCFSPTNNELSALSAKNICIWNTNTKKRHKKIKYLGQENGFYDYSSIQYSPDGNYIAAYNQVNESTQDIQLYDFQTIRHLEHHGLVTSFCFSLDNAKIVSCALGRIYIWDIAHKSYQELDPHGITAFCLLPDSKSLITADLKEIKFWDISSKTSYQTIPYGDCYIYSIIPSINNTFVVHAEDDCNLEKPFIPFIDPKFHDKPVIQNKIITNKTDFAPNGTLFASADVYNVNLYFNFNKTCEDALQSPSQLLFLEYAALLLQHKQPIKITKTIQKEVFKSLPQVLQVYLKPYLKLRKLKPSAKN